MNYFVFAIGIAFFVFAEADSDSREKDHERFGRMDSQTHQLMMNLTDSQRNEFKTILHDWNQTRPQLEQRLQQFSNQLSPTAQTSINMMVNRMKNMQMTDPSGLSQKAQTLFNQMKFIMNNNNLTIEQQNKQKEQLWKNADEQTRRELGQALYQQKMQNNMN